MPAVVVDKLSKVFLNPRGDQVQAVSEASFALESGELLVLVGPSGSGKTTLLRMIAGLEEPSSGTIRIDGKAVHALPPQDRDVAMVFQDHALYPHLTVCQNLAFGLALRKTPKTEIDTRVREVSDLLGLGSLWQRLPRALSGGEQQRVALGRALVLRPRVFLLDEPLSNLDAPLRAAMRREIARLHRRLGGVTIYVTHDQLEAMTLAQRMAVLHRGAIQQVGTPVELYRNPVNQFVAGFLGWPPQNFFRGILHRRDDTVWFSAGSESDPTRLSFQIESRRADRLRALSGKLVLFGLRAEHIRLLAPEETPSRCEVPLPAVVETVEPLGHETHLWFSDGRQTFVARSPAERSAEVGARLRVALRIDKGHFFDAEEGQRLV